MSNLRPIPELLVMPVPGETDVVTASVNCHGGRNLSHAYVQTKRSGYYKDVLVSALNRWNSGKITYFENIERAFRSCYTCKIFAGRTGSRMVHVKKICMSYLVAGVRVITKSWILLPFVRASCGNY